jgi:hypothetical protein
MRETSGAADAEGVPANPSPATVASTPAAIVAFLIALLPLSLFAIDLS